MGFYMKNKIIAAALCVSAILGTASCGTSVDKSGIVTQASSNTLTIKADDGTIYTYDIDEKTSFTRTAEHLGDAVEVKSKSYKEGVHADSIQVVKPAEATPIPGQSVTGRIKDTNKESISITTLDGNTYKLKKDGNTMIVSQNALAAEDTVEIIYVGVLSDGSAVAHNIILVSENTSVPTPTPVPADSKKADPTPEPEKYVTGICNSLSDNKIIFTYNTVEYAIEISPDTHIDVGISQGDTIRVFHKGKLSDDIVATRILLMAKAVPNPTPVPQQPTAAPQQPTAVPQTDTPAQPTNAPSSSMDDSQPVLKTVYGNITDAANAHISIVTADGTALNIFKDDYTTVNTPLSNGTPVEVFYDPDTMLAKTIN